MLVFYCWNREIYLGLDFFAFQKGNELGALNVLQRVHRANHKKSRAKYSVSDEFDI